MAMPTKAQVKALLSAGSDYREAGRRLGISPGLVYLIATGLPADGSDVPSPEERRERGLLPSSQELSNPAPENPTARDTVRRWVAERVRADSRPQRV